MGYMGRLRGVLVIALVLALCLMLSGCFSAPEDVTSTAQPLVTQLPFDQVTPRPAEVITPAPQASTAPTIRPIWQPAIAGQESWYSGDKSAEVSQSNDVQFVEDVVPTPRPQSEITQIIYTPAPTVAAESTPVPVYDAGLYDESNDNQTNYDETNYDDVFADTTESDYDADEPAPEPDIEFNDVEYYPDEDTDSSGGGLESSGESEYSGETEDVADEIEFMGETEDVSGVIDYTGETEDVAAEDNAGGASDEIIDYEQIAPEPEPEIDVVEQEPEIAPEPDIQPEPVAEPTEEPVPEVNGKQDLENSGATKATEQNGGLAVLSAVDGYIYYSSSADGGRLYRAMTDGSGREKVADDVPRGIFLLQGMVYYTTGDGIVSVNADGSGSMQVVAWPNVTQVNVFGANVVYSDGANVMLTSGASVPGVGFVADNYNGRLFISNGSGVGVYGLSDNGQLVESGNLGGYAVAGQTVFYTGGGRLLRGDIGGQERVLAVADASWVGVRDKLVYYVTPNGLYRVSPLGEGETQLVSGSVSDVRFADNGIEFCNDGSGTPNVYIGYDGGEINPLQ